MEQEVEKTTAVLSRTPAALDALLRGLPDAWTQANEGENTWNPRQIVGHLIDAERHDWVPRVKWLLAHGEGRAFEPFDRGGQARVVAGKSLPELLDEFARARKQSLEELRAMKLTPAELAKRGKHPALGTVTLSNLLATWAAHDLTHLHQLSRTMAHQYREAVGPWVKYLGVLKCAGHGD